MVAWGGQAAIVRLAGIALFPTDSYLYIHLPVALSYDCQITEWLLQRGLVQQCRIHPAAETAGILLAFYKAEETEVYVWAAVDVETLEVIHIEVSLDRSDPDALLFVKRALKRCRGEPVVLVDRGPWYNWVLDDLELCELCRETWGERSLVKAWFGLLEY